MINIKVSSQLLKKTLLLSVLLFVEVIKASPISFPSKNFEDLLLNNALRALNEDSPSNHAYQSGKLLYAKPILKQGAYTVWDVSVILNSDCSQGSPCPQKQCDMYIKQDQFNNLIVEDQSKQCNYNKREQNFNYIEKRYKREQEDPAKDIIDISTDDPVVKNYVNEGSKTYADEYLKTSKVFVTTINSASKQQFEDRIEYKIVFSIIKPTCIEEGISSSCSVDDNSPVRLCIINVLAKPQNKFNSTIMRTNCEANFKSRGA